jgi:hypothetical protein
MYIRKTTIKSNKTKEPYFTYRLVETHRVDGKVKQRTLLNLGRHFTVEREHWALLTSRVEQLLNREQSMFEIELSAYIEKIAQQVYSKLHQAGYGDKTPVADIQEVDISSLDVSRPRDVGVEQLALDAISQLGFINMLKEIGFNRHQIAASVGNIVARMVHPCSERATAKWLKRTSGLGELIGYDYESMGRDRLYSASDILLKNKHKIESDLYKKEQDRDNG